MIGSTPCGADRLTCSEGDRSSRVHVRRPHVARWISRDRASPVVQQPSLHGRPGGAAQPSVSAERTAGAAVHRHRLGSDAAGMAGRSMRYAVSRSTARRQQLQLQLQLQVSARSAECARAPRALMTRPYTRTTAARARTTVQYELRTTVQYVRSYAYYAQP